MNVRIYVATHRKEDALKSLSYPYVPIHVGKAIYSSRTDTSDGYLPELGDNTGDNISAKNPYYSELTAMYWIWKNDNSNPDDIVGLNHYRRYFLHPGSNNNELMTADDMRKILFNDGFDFIIDGYGTLYPDTTRLPSDAVYYGYSQLRNPVDLDNAVIAIHHLFPNIADTIEHELKHSAMSSYCNMLIARKKHFDEYASFLFAVLKYVEKELMLRNDDRMRKLRVPGYVAEKLLRPWILATGHRAQQGIQVFWNI